MKTFEQYMQEAGGEDRLDTACARLDRADPSHRMSHEEHVSHLIGLGHSPEIANAASKNRLNFRRIIHSPAFAANASMHSHGD